MPKRNDYQARSGANRGQGILADVRSRGAGNGTPRSASAQPKMESTMKITDDHQQQDDQADGAMLLGEDIPPLAVVNVDDSEDLLDTHISPDKETLFLVPGGVQDRTYGPSFILVQAAI